MAGLLAPVRSCDRLLSAHSLVARSRNVYTTRLATMMTRARFERLTVAGSVLTCGSLLAENDVETEARLDDVAHAARLEAERGLLELGHHAAARERAELTAAALARRVFGVLVGERCEVGAG